MRHRDCNDREVVDVVAPTGRAACAEAMQTALTKPAGPLPPQAPVGVLCGGGQASEVLGELARFLDSQHRAQWPPVSAASWNSPQPASYRGSFLAASGYWWSGRTLGSGLLARQRTRPRSAGFRFS
jgi:hypothetical protein